MSRSALLRGMFWNELPSSLLGLAFGALSFSDVLCRCHLVSRTWRRTRARWHKLILPTYCNVERAKSVLDSSHCAQVNEADVHVSLLDLLAFELKHLGVLRLKNRRLSSSDPAWSLSALKSFPRLRVLDLSFYRLVDGESELRNLHCLSLLRELDLSYSDLIRKACRELSRVTRLKTLHLTYVVMHLSLLELHRFTSLTSLSLGLHTMMKDNDLRELADLLSLRNLKLWLVDVTDMGLAHLKRLSLLQDLRCTSSKHITDSGLAHLTGLLSLERLDFSGTRKLTDNSLQYLAGLTGLRYLDLSFADQLTGEGFASLASLPSLQTLVLTDCQSLTHLENILEFPALISLDIRDCPLVDVVSPKPSHELSQLTKRSGFVIHL